MQSKARILVLFGAYFATAMLNGGGVFLCISEHGHSQIELAWSGCKSASQETNENHLFVSQPDCGDCVDYSLSSSYITRGRGGNQLQHSSVALAVNSVKTTSVSVPFANTDCAFFAEPVACIALRSTILII